MFCFGGRAVVRCGKTRKRSESRLFGNKIVIRMEGRVGGEREDGVVE